MLVPVSSMGELSSLLSLYFRIRGRREGVERNVSILPSVLSLWIDQLVESVMKLCLIMAKYGNNGAALAELEEQAASVNNANYQASGSRRSQSGVMPQNYQDSSGPQVIINNHCSTSSLQKQLQAVLQWIAASQFNIPTLYFMGDDDGQLEKVSNATRHKKKEGWNGEGQ